MAVRTIQTAQATLSVGSDGIMRMEYLPGARVTLENALLITAARAELTGERRLPLRVDTRNLAAMDREARVYYAGPIANRSVAAVALLVTSALGRAIGNFYLSLNRPLVPTRMFTTEDAAIAWLGGFLPEGSSGDRSDD